MRILISVIYVVLLGSWISPQVHADIQANIQTYQTLPNLYLAPEEVALINLDNYFNGFNLSFEGDDISPKYEVIDTSGLDFNGTVEISKTMKDGDLTRIVKYLPNQTISWTVFDSHESFFEDPYYLYLPDSVIGCQDLAFISFDYVVVDCWTEDVSYFFIIDINSENYTNITNNIYPGSGASFMTNADGYMEGDIVYYQLGAHWFFTVISFNLTANTIIWSNTFNVKSFEEFLTSNFVLTALTVWNSEVLIIASGNQIGMIEGNEVIFLTPVGDQTNTLALVSNTLWLSPGFLYSSILYNGNAGILEVIINKYESVLTVNSYKVPFASSVISMAQTNNYLGCVSFNKVTNTSYLTIYERGNTDPQTVFYSNKIEGLTTIHAIDTNNGNEGFLIGHSSIQAVYVRKPLVNITNEYPDRFTYSVNVTSLKETKNAKFKVEKLGEDDDDVYQTNRDMTIVRNVNESYMTNLNQAFIGPDLKFTLEFDEKESGYVFQNEVLGLNLPNASNITYAKLNAGFDPIEIYAQSGDYPTVLNKYFCEMDSSATNYDCILNVTGDIGVVTDLHLHRDYTIIIVENDPSNLTVYYSEPNDYSTAMSVIEGCTLVYLSSDSILEQTTYCVQNDQILVYSTTNHLYTWELDQNINKVMTHPDFPGLVFIGVDQNIIVYSSNFFKSNPIKISELNINGQYDFLITDDSMVVLDLERQTATEYDLRNPRNIVFRKSYMLFHYNIIYNPKAFVYSEMSNFFYFLAHPNYNVLSLMIMGFQTNLPGNSNLQYRYNLNEINQSNVILDVDYYNVDMDMLLVVTGDQLYIQKINDAPYLFLNSVNIQTPTQLFQSTTFNITAESFMNRMTTLTADSTLINTQREILLKENITVPTLDLQLEGEANISFKGEDIFVGPAYYIHLDLDYHYDNIELTNRIEYNSKSLDKVVYAAAENSNYVAVLSKNEIFFYDLAYFPQKFHTNHSIDYTCEIAEMAIDKHSLVIACGDDVNNNVITHFEIDSRNDSCSFTVDYCVEEVAMKVSGQYLYVLVPYVFNTLQIYKLYQDNCAQLVHTVNIYQLGLKPGEVAYSLDVYTSTDELTTYIFITTASSIFKTIIINEGSEPIITEYPNLYRKVAPDHFDNARTDFAGIKLHDINETSIGLINFEVLVSSLNAFSYLFHCSMTTDGAYKDCFIVKGFVQYQGYEYKPLLFATSRYFALIGTNFRTKKNDVFMYDLQAQNYLPYHLGRYPLYDSFQAMPSAMNSNNPALLFDKGGYHVFLYYNSEDVEFDEYIIRENFTVYSNASHLSSPNVMVIGKNDYWSVEYGIQVLNYGALFRGVSSLLIVLIVFFSLVTIFLLFVCINRYFRFKEKRTLKDEMNFVSEGYFKFEKDQIPQ